MSETVTQIPVDTQFNKFETSTGKASALGRNMLALLPNIRFVRSTTTELLETTGKKCTKNIIFSTIVFYGGVAGVEQMRGRRSVFLMAMEAAKLVLKVDEFIENKDRFNGGDITTVFGRFKDRLTELGIDPEVIKENEAYLRMHIDRVAECMDQEDTAFANGKGDAENYLRISAFTNAFALGCYVVAMATGEDMEFRQIQELVSRFDVCFRILVDLNSLPKDEKEDKPNYVRLKELGNTEEERRISAIRRLNQELIAVYEGYDHNRNSRTVQFAVGALNSFIKLVV